MRKFWRFLAFHILQGSRFVRINFRTRLWDAFVLQFWVMTKVNEETELEMAGLQVVQDLSAMLIRQLADSLQLDNDFLVADKIGKVFLVEDSTSILEGQSWQGDRWNMRMLEFNVEAFLINRLVKSAALIFVHFEASTDNGVAFVLENEVGR